VTLIAMVVATLAQAPEARGQEIQLGPAVDPLEIPAELTGPIVSLIGAVHLVGGGVVAGVGALQEPRDMTLMVGGGLFAVGGGWAVLGVGLRTWEKSLGVDDEGRGPPAHPAMWGGGMALTLVGASLAAGGWATKLIPQRRGCDVEQDDEPRNDCRGTKTPAEGLMIIGGSVGIAIGMPMWILGSRRPASGPLAGSTTCGPWLLGAGCSGTF
jgi:hypothetical protein